MKLGVWLFLETSNVLIRNVFEILIGKILICFEFDAYYFKLRRKDRSFTK